METVPSFIVNDPLVYQEMKWLENRWKDGMFYIHGPGSLLVDLSIVELIFLGRSRQRKIIDNILELSK